MDKDKFFRSFKVQSKHSFDLFLGSGASVASGIPTGGELVLHFKREILISQGKINAHKYNDLKIESVRKEIQQYFDDLIEKAIHTLNYQSCQIVSPDTANSVNNFRKDIPTVVKLHGDFRYDSLQNTNDELKKLENNLHDYFVESASKKGLIVVGL